MNVSSIPLLAGSLCGIKSLFASQLVLFQIPRVMELFSYLGPQYIEITDENDFPFGLIVIPLDGRCVTDSDRSVSAGEPSRGTTGSPGVEAEGP